MGKDHLERQACSMSWACGLGAGVQGGVIWNADLRFRSRYPVHRYCHDVKVVGQGYAKMFPDLPWEKGKRKPAGLPARRKLERSLLKAQHYGVHSKQSNRWNIC